MQRGSRTHLLVCNLMFSFKNNNIRGDVQLCKVNLQEPVVGLTVPTTLNEQFFFKRENILLHLVSTET